MERNKRTKEELNIDKLRRLAKQVGCDDNPLFITELDKYSLQLKVINLIREELSNSELAVSKEYVKGRENLYAHPLIKELPKHSDSATKSATFLWNLIRDYHPTEKADPLDGFLNKFDDV